MRQVILNPLIPRTPNIGRETSEKQQFSESDFLRKTHFSRIRAKLLHARNIPTTTNYHLKLIIPIPFEHYCTVLVIFLNICQLSTSFHRLLPFSRIFWTCNNFALRLKNRFFRKKLLSENCFFSLVSWPILGVLGINGFRIAKHIVF